MPRHIIRAAKRPLVKGPVGYCIYCGKRPPEAVLSKEDVMPVGLGGGLILLKASCEACRKLTWKFEETTLRKTLLAFRTHEKIRTRRPKERPTHLKARIGGTQRKVAVEDHPLELPLIRLPRPGILTGRPYGRITLPWSIDRFANPDNIKKLEEMHGDSVRDDSDFHIPEFLQMLAKIAYGIVWDLVGPGNFRPYVLGIIFGTEPDISYYVGEDLGNHHCTHNDMHHTDVGFGALGNRTLVVVHFHLFKQYNPIVYEVIVGELTASEDWLIRHGLFRSGATITEVRQ